MPAAIGDARVRKATQCALEESEGKYRRLVENLRTEYFFYSHGPDGVFIWVSPSVENILGYSVEEFLTHYADFFTDNPINEAALRHSERSCAGEKQPPYALEVTHRLGDRRMLEVNESPVFDGDGRLVAVEGIAHDVTDRRTREQEMLRVQKLEALSLLAGGIAHDFNNLLAAVLFNTSLLLETFEQGDTRREALEDVHAAGMHAKQLTQQLMAFARGGAPVKRACDLGAIVRDAARLAASGSNVALRLEVPSTLAVVEADPGQLQQALGNLVLNAVQAMPDGGSVRVSCDEVTLEDQTRPPLAAGRYVRVVVHDDGVGIPAAHLPRVFDPYFTTKAKGSGLGLAVCHAVVRNHGGHVAVESELGHGSTFSVWLPAVAAKIACAPSRASSSVLGRGRVLVMDDEALVARGAVRLLKSLGYEAEVVSDGAAAIAAYEDALRRGRPFDVLLLDLTVPGGVGGQEAFERLRSSHPDLCAIASSGYCDSPVMSKYREHGFAGAVAKPYTKRDLDLVLRDVLG